MTLLFVIYITDAKRAKLTPHNNHLPLQGVLVLKDTVSLTAIYLDFAVFVVACCPVRINTVFEDIHDHRSYTQLKQL